MSREEIISEKLTESFQAIKNPYNDSRSALIKARAVLHRRHNEKPDIRELEEFLDACHNPLQELHIEALDAKENISSIMTGGLLDDWEPQTTQEDARADAMYSMASVNRELNRKIYWPLSLSSSDFERSPRNEHSGEPDPLTVKGTRMKKIDLVSGAVAYVVIDERGISI